ncbi:hypothetical protein [Vannielia litorea]|uniref:Uncharacterized protein n=1 Tax=Vannielia litorea TaxID=1217970 RepID=A0A1N6DV29_9RHOB|nr:hypothetical protein [Vannielia litorea]SIN74573.1 hypothetical protein SAMN05444002_0034 [Vannielia litorea]
MTARSPFELALLGVALVLLSACEASTNEPPYPPGIHFTGKAQMGVAKDADGNIRMVTRITD